MSAPKDSTTSAEVAPLSLAEVDVSCRWTLTFLAGKSAFWLVVGSLFSLLASVKLHAPGMMSGTAWLTYGRVLPAGWNALVYGFAGQAAWAVGLWLLARVSAQRLQGGWLVLGGGAFWNLGILAGVIGILSGNTTGRELLEFPAGAMALLMVGAGMIGCAGWMTFAARRQAFTYPSAWFVLLAVLSIVWFGTVALMMLPGEGIRGVTQVLVQRWFARGIMNLWLGGLALAILHHFLPILAKRPLASRPLALVSFWCLVFFTPWAITEHGDPFPRWIVSAGLAGRTLGAIGLLALAFNLWKTTEGAWKVLFSTVAGRLVGCAAVAYVAGGALQYLLALRVSASVVGLTWTGLGLDWLALGAVMLAVTAVMPEAVARCSGRALSPTLVAVHGWLSLGGLALIAVPLILAGVTQGGLMAGRSSTFLDALRMSLHWVRISSLGYTLFFLGQLAWVAALAVWMKSWLADWIVATRSWMATPAAGKGVTARP